MKTMRTTIMFGIVIAMMTPLVANATNLSDIEGNKNQTAIEYLYDNSVISGYPDGTFKPANTVNRAELIKILVGGKGVTPTLDQYKNCFPDVKEDWFAPYVCYAKIQNWVSGYPDGSFKPSQEVNKGEAIKMLVNSQGYTVPEAVLSNVYDDVTSKDWFAPFVKVAKDMGLLEETGSYFHPSGKMTRAGISENIYRAMTYVAPSENQSEPEPQEEPVITDSQEIDGLASINAMTMQKNWDADAEKDGIEVSIVYYDSHSNNISTYDTVKIPISVNLKLYTATGGIYSEKDRLVFSKNYTSDEVINDNSIYSIVRIPREEITTNSTDYPFGVLEVTITTPKQGEFSVVEESLVKVIFDD